MILEHLLRCTDVSVRRQTYLRNIVDAFTIYFVTRKKYLARQTRTLKVRHLNSNCGRGVMDMIYTCFVVTRSLIEQSNRVVGITDVWSRMSTRHCHPLLLQSHASQV